VALLASGMLGVPDEEGAVPWVEEAARIPENIKAWIEFAQMLVKRLTGLECDEERALLKEAASPPWNHTEVIYRLAGILTHGDPQNSARPQAPRARREGRRPQRARAARRQGIGRASGRPGRNHVAAAGSGPRKGEGVR
jgi:hypothetical protein